VQRVGRARVRPRLDLDDRHAVRQVDRAVERDTRPARVGPERQHRAGQGRRLGQQRPEPRRRLLSQQAHDPPPRGLLRGNAQQALDVAAHLDGAQGPRVERQQHAVRLDRSWDADRLAVAVGQVGFAEGGLSRDHAPLWSGCRERSLPEADEYKTADRDARIPCTYALRHMPVRPAPAGLRR